MNNKRDTITKFTENAKESILDISVIVMPTKISGFLDFHADDTPINLCHRVYIVKQKKKKN